LSLPIKNMMEPEGLRLSVFNTCWQLARTAPVLLRDEVDLDDIDGAEDRVGGWDSDSRIRERGSAAAPGIDFPVEYTAAAGFWNHDRLFEGGE